VALAVPVVAEPVRQAQLPRLLVRLIPVAVVAVVAIARFQVLTVAQV
jgi:hypothetical protein